jgi:hypothetical protein
MFTVDDACFMWKLTSDVGLDAILQTRHTERKTGKIGGS